MPLIDFRVLRELVAEYDRLTATKPGSLAAPAAPVRRRLEDLQYTVCVYTGLRDSQQAMTRARGLLREHSGRAAHA